MRLKFLAGHKSQQIWSELVVLPLSVGMQFEWRGQAWVWVGLITIKASEQTQELGQELIRHLDEEFATVSQPLEKEELREWWQGVELQVAGELAITMVQISQSGQVIVVTRGEQGILVRRGEKGGWLVKPNPDEWQTLVGRGELNDRWLLGTKTLFEAVGTEAIMVELKQATVEETQAELMAIVQKGNYEGVAGALVDFGEEGEKIEPVTAEPEPAAPKVYLKKEQPYRRRRFLALGVGLIVLLVMGVWAGGKRKAYVEEKREFEQTMTGIEQLVAEANGLAALNGPEAAAKLKTAEANLETARDKFGAKPDYVAQIKLKTDQVKQLYVGVSGEQELEVSEPWYDLNLIKENLFGTKMDQTDERMEILDGQQAVVASIGFDKKEATLTGSGGLIKDGSLIAVSGKRTLVLVATSGVYELNTIEKTTGQLIPLDSTWQRIVAMGLFAGNVYMVDAGARDIYVYPGLSSGVGEGRRWLKPGQEPDLAAVVDMAIDGDLWTIDDNGKIRRFRQGEQIDYAVSGLEKPVGRAVAIVAPPESEKIYILDQGEKRVVEASKKGQYEKQYLWDGLAGATDMVVDEVTGGIYALSGSQIFRLSMATAEATP